MNGHPKAIEVRGARKNNLKNIDVDIPLGCITGIAGVSGSGKSSLAVGIVYAEGARRYLESLSTYTRRRMTQAARAEVDEVRYVPAALALRQRPGCGRDGGRVVATGTLRDIAANKSSVTGRFL